MTTRFREIRLYCHIPLCETAAAANISPQRLSQYELRFCGYAPRDPERLIAALEQVIGKRKKEIERVEYILRHERNTIFDYAKGGGIL